MSAPPQTEADAVRIGLEVHVQLASDRKLLSPALRRHAPEAPNEHIDPFSIGLPGALPVLNPQAVWLATQVALALDCSVAPRSEWDRKHYFYPDLPKGFQITQQRQPLATRGALDILGDDDRPLRVRIDRVHLEEDAGKCVHGPDGQTRVDFNRAGAALIEVVSAPDLRTPTEARRLLKRIRAIVRAVGASTAHMEQGELRADANVSVGQPRSGARVEIKNLNSFRHVEQALTYEIGRQQSVLQQGETVATETRRWDATQRVTRVTRTKESSAGYRYLPEPDLPALEITDAWLQTVQRALPELPAAKMIRYLALGLPPSTADVLADDIELAAWFDREVGARTETAPGVAQLLLGEVSRLKNAASATDIRLKSGDLAALAEARAAGRISATQQKALVARLWNDGGDVAAHIAQVDLVVDAAQLRPVIQEVLDQHPDVVEKYRAGKRGVMGHLMGGVMKATRGRAHPQTARALLEQLLENIP